MAFTFQCYLEIYILKKNPILHLERGNKIDFSEYTHVVKAVLRTSFRQP